MFREHHLLSENVVVCAGHRGLRWCDLIKGAKDTLATIPWRCLPMSHYLLTDPQHAGVETVFVANKPTRCAHLLYPWDDFNYWDLMRKCFLMFHDERAQNHTTVVWSMKATEFSCKMFAEINACICVGLETHFKTKEAAWKMRQTQ